MQPLYPLTLRFKIIALASQIYVEDAHGTELLYLKQKAFKLKEDVRVFQTKEQTQELYQMKADRILDVSPRFSITDAAGQPVGAIKREGLRSIWKASYLLEDANGVQTHHIKEESPWLKVLDQLLNEVPILGFFTGYLIHPTYVVLDAATEQPVFRLTKMPAFFEGRFKVEKLVDIPDPDLEMRLVLAQMLMMVFERARG